MEYLDMEKWERKDLYASYVGQDLPYIIVTAEVDVTGLYRKAKAEGFSFYFGLVYAASQAADSIRNFHYRVVDGRPCYIERGTPTATHKRPGEDLFVMAECDHYDDIKTFAIKNREKAERLFVEGNPREPEGRTDIYNFSAIPWIRFTGFVRTIGKLGVDTNPKFTIGKYAKKDGRVTVPFSVQTHHGLMDGYHVGLFYERFQQLLDTYE
jgi:chloramphenicol O-acetyltransferase type A